MTREVSEDWLPLWKQAWSRDKRFYNLRNEGHDAFFDRRSGEVLFVAAEGNPELEDDEERARRDKFEGNPDRYDEIPPVPHATRHDWFSRFREERLKDLVDSQEQLERVWEVTNDASIGGFKDTLREFCTRSLADRVWRDWQNFEDRMLRRRAARWLAERGWTASWAPAEEGDRCGR